MNDIRRSLTLRPGILGRDGPNFFQPSSKLSIALALDLKSLQGKRSKQHQGVCNCCHVVMPRCNHCNVQTGFSNCEQSSPNLRFAPCWSLNISRNVCFQGATLSMKVICAIQIFPLFPGQIKWPPWGLKEIHACCSFWTMAQQPRFCPAMLLSSLVVEGEPYVDTAAKVWVRRCTLKPWCGWMVHAGVNHASLMFYTKSSRCEVLLSRAGLELWEGDAWHSRSATKQLEIIIEKNPETLF